MGALAKLTHVALRNAKPGDKQIKLADGGGLYLAVMPNDAMFWRYDFRCNGKQSTLALGVYPAVSASQAREEHQKARAQLAQGIDPNAERKKAKLLQANAMADAIETIARELWKAKLRAGRSARYVESIIGKLEKGVFPRIGARR